MRYEYRPTLLNDWLRDNRNVRMESKLENSNVKYVGELEKLRVDFQIVKHFPKGSFANWALKLTRRQKLLLPNLYNSELKPHVKDNLLQVIKDNVKNEKRLFRVLVDSTYQSCDLEDLWGLLKYSYAIHEEKIQKRFTEKQKANWEEFIDSKDPVHHLAVSAYGSENGFLKELESYFLTENFPLYKYVLMDIFTFADESFFVKEKEIFKKFFKTATNEEQQKMADGLIKNCKLNTVKELGKVIFEKLKTYRRKPMLWKQVGDAEKRRFANWILKMEIKDFFGNINTNHERYQYWKKFTVNLEDVVVTDNRSTIIMYFPDVVIMEVLGTGAVYVYKTSEFNRHFQKKIDDMLAEKEKFQNKYFFPREVRRSELMDKYCTVQGGWLVHTGDWQFKFDSWLRSHLGWEVREDVLLQKEAERDEGGFDS
jgi:hypothetical protein